MHAMPWRLLNDCKSPEEAMLEHALRADPPPLKWSDWRYVLGIKVDCNGKEAIQA
jgi:hypothetical protein